MSCICTIDAIGGDCNCDFYCKEVRRAHKPHVCQECGSTILPGEQYERYAGVWGRDFSVYKTCLPCVEIRKCFLCTWVYGQVHNDIAEWFKYNEPTIGDISKLSPLAAIKFEECVLGLIDSWSLDE